jgi:hypothetical protein
MEEEIKGRRQASRPQDIAEGGGAERGKGASLRRASDQPATSKNHVFFYTTNHHPAFRLEIVEQSYDFCSLFKISSFSKNPLQN